MKKLTAGRSAAVGAFSGAVNGFFGSGGGMLAVPLLEENGTETKKAHATSLAIMLPLSIVSAFIYMQKGSIDMKAALSYIPGGLLGVLAGSFILKKISSDMLQKLFACVMIYFGIRMLLH